MQRIIYYRDHLRTNADFIQKGASKFKARRVLIISVEDNSEVKSQMAR